MKLKEIYKLVLNKLNLKEGDKQTESVIKSAINQAYIMFAERDCILKEHQYLVCNNILELPEDFLIYHSLYINVLEDDTIEIPYKIPRHYLEIKANKLVIRDDLIGDSIVKDIKLVYGLKPTELIVDNDTPIINVAYHQGLMYYALFLMSDDKKYYDLFMTIYNSIPKDHYVADYTSEEGMSVIKSIRGKQGIQGPQGEIGLQGIQGIQGEKGIQGDIGLQGEQGIQGIQGIQGEQGIQGVQGEKGDQGLQGIQGEKGEQGLQGIQGIQGEQGTSGLLGGTLTDILVAQNNTAYTTKQVRNIILSTLDANINSMQNGDIWIKYV